MIKGHVAIELHNHKTGLRDRIEGDNMVTNALNYAIPNVIGANYSADNIMPICQKALGSVMLFDGLLTEDKNNIFGVGVSDREFRTFIIDYLLGKH